MTDFTKLSRRSALGLITGAATTPFMARQAFAERLKVDITGGNFQPLPIAIPTFLGDGDMGPQITQVIAANLTRSGYFQVLDQRSHVERLGSVDQPPNFQSWRVINAQALAVGNVTRGGQGLVAQYRLWDIFATSQLDGRQFTTTAENWRRLAHIISDAIYEALTGEKGYFDSRVVYVDETGSKQQRSKRLAVMDQDGANVKYLTQGGSTLVLTPRFSPAGQDVTYMQFGSADPKVFMLNIASGARSQLGEFAGMSFSPRFAPDGRRVVMSLLNNDGNSNIAIMDVGSRKISRLTDGAQIDTGACFSPDGSRIVFESDRGGGQQLYVMSASGGGATRISFGQGRYSTPVWSPKGDYIAFTKQGGGFSIGVMKPDGTGERILTTGYHNEGPTWAPNGRVLMYFKDQGAGPQLYTIDVSGRFEQALKTPGFASDPAWGPRLS